MDEESKIEKAKELKAQGNQCYKDGESRKAMKLYHNALLHVHDTNTTLKNMLSPLGAETEKGIRTETELEELKAARKAIQFGCHNNISACLIKEKRWERALSSTEKALALQPDNTKALFRNGQVLFELGNVAAASEKFQRVKELTPADKSVDKYLKIIEVKKKQYALKEKDMYARMIGGS